MKSSGLTPNYSKTQLLPITQSRKAPTLNVYINGKHITMRISELSWRYHHSQPVLITAHCTDLSESQTTTWHDSPKAPPVPWPDPPPDLSHSCPAQTWILRSLGPAPSEGYQCHRECAKVCCQSNNSRVEVRLATPPCAQNWIGKLWTSRERYKNSKYDLSIIPTTTFTPHPHPSPRHPHSKILFIPYTSTYAHKFSFFFCRCHPLMELTSSSCCKQS